MLKKTFILTALMASALVCAFEVKNIEELDQETLSDFMNGNQPDLILEFDEGAEYPLHIFLDGDIVSIIGNEKEIKNSVRVNQKMFLARSSDMFYFSTDFENWKNFNEFFMGNASIGFAITDEANFAYVGAQLNKRVDPPPEEEAAPTEEN